MSRNTGIEWTDDTWNPIRGCSRVSEGCRHCYAEGVAYRFSGAGQPYEGLVRIGADGARRPEWNGEIQFVEKHLLDPLKWGSVLEPFPAEEGAEFAVYSDRPRRIFVNSMSDLFHENVTDAMHDLIFAVMALCQLHTFQVLTKRPERMLAYLTDKQTWPRIVAQMEFLHAAGKVKADQLALALVTGMPLPQVQLGVSVEDQPTANKRIPLLLQTPAAARFISAEPLLASVDLEHISVGEVVEDEGERVLDGFRYNALTGDAWADDAGDLTGDCGLDAKLDWVIVGGESGPGARPMHPDWVRSLRDQCVAAGVPFFFKQWGEWIEVDGPRCRSVRPELSGSAKVLNADGSLEERKSFHSPYRDVLVSRVGKKVAGHLLDGQVWQQFPEVRA